MPETKYLTGRRHDQSTIEFRVGIHRLEKAYELEVHARDGEPRKYQADDMFRALQE